MSDELKPELKDALKDLPRERMPSGLEARVTDAMRERGFLPKRRRTVAVTGSRAAGLLAACVALMIGAYSIGLHRGGGDQVVPSAIPPAPKELGRADQPLPDKVERKAQTPIAELEAPEAEQADEAQAAPSTAKDDRGVEKRAEGRLQEAMEESPASPRQDAPARALSKSAPQPQPDAAAIPESAVKPQVFLLNGFPVVIDAPDSVRVVEDQRGRTILIYTSDGVIRIRSAENN